MDKQKRIARVFLSDCYYVTYKGLDKHTLSPFFFCFAVSVEEAIGKFYMKYGSTKDIQSVKRGIEVVYQK